MSNIPLQRLQESAGGNHLPALRVLAYELTQKLTRVVAASASRKRAASIDVRAVSKVGMSASGTTILPNRLDLAACSLQALPVCVFGTGVIPP